MPRELLTIGVGQAGTQVSRCPRFGLGQGGTDLPLVQVSQAFWESIVQEHGLDNDGVRSFPVPPR